MTRQPGFGAFRPGTTTPTLVFERRLLVPVTRAWQLITDPGALAIWLRANADIEPRAGGAVRLQFTNSPSIVHGVVQRYDPPHALAYTWPDAQGRSSLVTFELFADGPDATRLVLTHALDAAAPLEEFGAGWHTHLELLDDMLAGRPVSWPGQRWHALVGEYAALQRQLFTSPQPQGGTMQELQLTQVPVMQTGMLIRRPAAEVFEAIVNPDMTTQFWFTKSSGRLEAGRQVRWEWEMYDVAVPVRAAVVEPHSRVVIEWPGYSGETTVEWRLAPYGGDATFVSVSETGFTGNGDQLVQQVADSTQGFTLMLAGMKAFLEHDLRLNLVGDRYPKGLEQH